MFEIICAIICGALSLIFLIISIMSFMKRGFLFMALDCYFLTDWLWILSGTFSVAAIIYAVVSSRNETDKE